MIPHISTIDLFKLASGDVLSLQVYKFRGTSGKKAYIQANLHGAEIVGNGVIQQLIEFLTALDPSQLQRRDLVSACMQSFGSKSAIAFLFYG